VHDKASLRALPAGAAVGSGDGVGQRPRQSPMTLITSAGADEFACQWAARLMPMTASAYEPCGYRAG